MGGLEFFWDASQERRLQRLKREGIESDNRLQRAASDVERLQQDLDRLTLACAAMWSLFKDQGLTEEQLLDRMQELDLRDGKLDGRLAVDVVACSACGRKSKAVRRSCLYCGKELPAGPAFGKS